MVCLCQSGKIGGTKCGHVWPDHAGLIGNVYTSVRLRSSVAGVASIYPSRAENVEKGQLDKKESEWKKQSSPGKPGTPTTLNQPIVQQVVEALPAAVPPPPKPATLPQLDNVEVKPSFQPSSAGPISFKRPSSDEQKSNATRSSSSGLDDKYHQEQLRLHKEQAKQEQLRLEQIQQEQKRQQGYRKRAGAGNEL